MQKHKFLLIIPVFFIIFAVCTPYDNVKTTIWKGKLQFSNEKIESDIELYFDKSNNAVVYFQYRETALYGNIENTYTLTDTNYFYFNGSDHFDYNGIPGNEKITLELDGFLNYYNNTASGDFTLYNVVKDRYGSWYLKRVE